MLWNHIPYTAVGCGNCLEKERSYIHIISPIDTTPEFLSYIKNYVQRYITYPMDKDVLHSIYIVEWLVHNIHIIVINMSSYAYLYYNYTLLVFLVSVIGKWGYNLLFREKDGRRCAHLQHSTCMLWKYSMRQGVRLVVCCQVVSMSMLLLKAIIIDWMI